MENNINQELKKKNDKSLDEIRREKIKLNTVIDFNFDYSEIDPKPKIVLNYRNLVKLRQ